MTPHKATPGAWKNVRDWAKNEGAMYAVPSVLIEIADRVAALEEASSELTGTIASADSDIERRLTALESQHNLMVDSITDLQGCVNQLEAAATQPPATAADHSRGAPEMVATDEELIETFYVGTRGPFPSGFRAVYNLGRQHGAQSRQEEDPSQLSDGYHTFAELYEHRHALFLALMRAMPQHCWFSLRHADGERCFGGDDWFIAGAELPGGSSVTYHLPADLYLLARATGASRLDLGRPWDGHTASDVVSRLMEWASQPRQEVEPTPPPAPVTTGCGSTSKAVGFAAAPLLWVLWHHLGASSPVGQPIRRYLGMGQHDRMTPEGIEAAKRWARESMGVQDYLDSIPAYSSDAPDPTPSPAPDDISAAQPHQERETVPVLWVRRKPGPGCNASVIAWLPSVEDLPIGEHILYAFPGASQPRQEVEPTPSPAPTGGLVVEVAGVIWSSCEDLEIGARNAIHCVADWLQQRSSTIANGSRWAEMLRTETDRSSAAPPRPVPQPPAPAGGLVEELASVAAQAVLTELTQQAFVLDPADIPREAPRMARLAATALRAAALSMHCGKARIHAIADELEGWADG
jgi:hypothetical protein